MGIKSVSCDEVQGYWGIVIDRGLFVCLFVWRIGDLVTVWKSDLVCNPNLKPSSNIDDAINNVIFNDGQILTKTKNNENDNRI